MRRLTRRQFVGSTAAASAAILGAPFVRGAYAAGKLTVAQWDHFVPGANKVAAEIVNEWAQKERIDVELDFITSQGNKLLLTSQAEAQAKVGHDVFRVGAWQPRSLADSLEPLDDLMAAIIRENGNVNETLEYLGRAEGKWLGVPACYGTQLQPPCSRIDLMKEHAKIDVQAMYPAGSPPNAADWTMETFLKAAEACHKAGFPFGIGLGDTNDSVSSAAAIFQSFGASLVDATGQLTVRTDEVRQALEFYKRLVRFLPPGVGAWDDASNNKWLIAGKGALICNPPSAWAVAKRDAPRVAEQLWTHGMPAGPKGRFAPYLPNFYTVWSFSKKKEAAKSLIAYLSQRSSIERMVTGSAGMDLPPYEQISNLAVWADAEPPKGTLYHYANRFNHQKMSVAGWPAPPRIATQIYSRATMTKLVLRYAQGEKLESALAWAESECEGFLRT